MNNKNTLSPKRKKLASILLWILAFFLTCTIAIYQRLTGPTYPVRNTETINDTIIKYKLLRTYDAHESLPVEINIIPPQTLQNQPLTNTLNAYLNHKRYNNSDPWTEIPMTRDGNTFHAEIPGQPAAGKVEYTIRMTDGKVDKLINNGQSIVARFKGKVPRIYLTIHIIFMFASILLALKTGMETLRKDGNYVVLTNLTLLSILIGGMIMGPIVQKYAFGDFWTGFPFGYDLTDNKTLIAFIAWIAAWIATRILKEKSKWLVLAAVLIMMTIYMIPHSVMGSELDYNTGKMKNKYSFYKQFQSPVTAINDDYRPGSDVCSIMHDLSRKHEFLRPKPPTS